MSYNQERATASVMAIVFATIVFIQCMLWFAGIVNPLPGSGIMAPVVGSFVSAATIWAGIDIWKSEKARKKIDLDNQKIKDKMSQDFHDHS